MSGLNPSFELQANGLGAGGFGSLAGLGSLRAESAADVTEHRSFEDVLGIARSHADGRTSEERAREGAEQLVATVFLEPVLKSFRANSQAAEPFAPTRGEQQFRGMLDARVALDVVRRSDLTLVDRIANDLLNAGGA